MNLTIEEIQEQVRITLDENQVETDIIAGEEATLEMDEIISQKILQAALQILQTAPLPLIDTTKSLVFENAKSNAKGVITVDCPYDFLRLSVAQADDWKVPVRVVVTDMDDEYLATQSDFAGIRPSKSRPLVALVETDGSKRLEFYGSTGASHTLIKARYIAMPRIDNGIMSFPERLVPALLYLTAALVAMTYKDAHAQALTAMAQSYMGT